MNTQDLCAPSGWRCRLSAILHSGVPRHYRNRGRFEHGYCHRGNYEVGLSKVSNGDPKEDQQIRRNVGRTEVFSLQGNFKKISDGPKVYFKIDISGGVGSTVVGRWVELEKVGDQATKSFYSGDVDFSQKAKEIQVKLLVDDKIVHTWSFELV